MIVTILIFFAVLSVLVIAHEFGHYVLARWAGVKIDEFGMGFPPRLGYFTDKRGTKWSLNLIPLGGFVKLKEEEGGGTAKDGFAAQPKLKRGAILIAGVVMNVIVAMVLYSIVVLFGAPTVLGDSEVPRFAHVVKEETLILEVASDTSAAEEGVPMGGQLLSVNGAPIENEVVAREQLSTLAVAGEQVALEIKLGDETKVYTLTPQQGEGDERAYYGFYFADTTYIRYPFPVNIWIGIRTGFEYLALIVLAFAGLLWDLVTGAGVQEAVSGPVGIAKVTGQVAQLGVIPLLQFAALLSLNLAVLNVFPFPALDGGRLFFLGLEAVRKKPLKESTEARIHQFGFLFLMILVVLVTYRDIAGIL